MTMSEINPALAVDLAKILDAKKEQQPEEVEIADAEKAKQLPEPKTFMILTMVPEAEETIGESAIIKTSTMIHHEEVLTPVLFVVKLGPDCYKDESRFPSGPSCNVGDFVIVRPNTGTRLKIHGREFRLINDDSVEAVVQDPRGISRAA
jgi:co-chaperonin GroES (HSP10)